MSTPLSDFEASELHQLKHGSSDEQLGKPDSFLNSQFFGVSAEAFMSGARETFHAQQSE